MNTNMEQRVFEYLGQRQGVELCEACIDMPFFCSSIRQALRRLCDKGQAGSVLMRGRIALYFIHRDAQRPDDKRGKRRG